MSKRKDNLLYEPDNETRRLMKMSAAEQVAEVRKALGYQTYDKPPKYWLDTGSKWMNRVFGSKMLGIAYGKTITLAGMYSSGKTLIANKIAGWAQKDGAKVAYVDIENSADSEWSAIHGLDFGKRVHGGWSKVALFQPEVGIFGKTKKQKSMSVRMQTAEELFTMVKQWMLMQRSINPKCKLCVLVDSTTAIIPEEEMVAGFDKSTMRSNLSLPVFLNRLTKHWNQLALNTNAIVIYVSQLRINPAQLYGNPERIPGGNGVLFYPSIVNKVKRVKGGLILDAGGAPVGLQSVITNMKNKMGGNSTEGLKCGFQAMFHEPKWKFMSSKDLIKLAERNKRSRKHGGNSEEE